MGATASALQEDDTTSLNNIDFYTNKLSSKPDGGKIDYVLANWFGDWDKLEVHHGYVQWLFPIREGGLNFSAQPLSKHEASVFRQSPEILKRCVKAYEVMLDFYGMVLVDRKTGVIARNPKTYKGRYAHLNNSFHNYLRITRICKFLGIIGLEHYKKEFLRHLIIEVYHHGLLDNADESCIKYWVPTLRKPEDLQEMDALVETILKQKVPRQKIGYGDEDGVNWATKLYPQEADLPDDDLEPKREAVPADVTSLTTTTTTTPDVLTYAYDPFAEIHKKFESTAKKHDFMNFRMGGMGQMNAGGPRRVQVATSTDSDEEESYGKVYRRSYSSEEEDSEDEQDRKQAKLTITDSHFSAAAKQKRNDKDDEDEDLDSRRKALNDL